MHAAYACESVCMCIAHQCVCVQVQDAIDSHLDGNADPDKLRANIENLKSHYEAKIAKLSDNKASKEQQESLGEIRARTMYKMVEDIEEGETKKLLFLTNNTNYPWV